jgi:hypothetical protein
MMTHVKRNAQRAAFTKSSHIECAVQFRNLTLCMTGDCQNPRENNLYQGHRKMQTELIEYMKYGGGIYNFGGIF